MQKPEMQETIVYGGSFNPPTRAHLGIMESCLRQKPAADFWLMPSGERHDKQHGVDTAHRLELLGSLIESLEDGQRVDVCKLEIENCNLTETCHTVERLNQLYPGRLFRYIFGSDAYDSMATWRNGEHMRANLPMIVIPRAGAIVAPADNVEIVEFVMLCSSTEVRERVGQQQAVEDLVPRAVARYIEERKLYQGLSSVA
jgi:nicotinate-nucleotide adenylyltransferase